MAQAALPTSDGEWVVAQGGKDSPMLYLRAISPTAWGNNLRRALRFSSREDAQQAVMDYGLSGAAARRIPKVTA